MNENWGQDELKNSFFWAHKNPQNYKLKCKGAWAKSIKSLFNNSVAIYNSPIYEKSSVFPWVSLKTWEFYYYVNWLFYYMGTTDPGICSVAHAYRHELCLSLCKKGTRSSAKKYWQKNSKNLYHIFWEIFVSTIPLYYLQFFPAK